MSNDAASSETQSFGDRLYGAFIRLLRAFVRLVLILLVALVIGVLVYTAVPRFYSQYVQPVRDNAAAIEAIQARQALDADQFSGRQESLQERLDNLEVQSDQDKQVIGELQSELADLGRLVALQEEALAQAADQSSQRLDDVQDTIASLDEAINDLDEALVGLAGDVEFNLAETTELSAAFNATGNPINSFRRELQLVKAMELITRSRLSLAQSNLGLVEQDVTLARDLLVDLQPVVFDYQEDALLAIVSRLELALGNLPEELELVEADLEAAWGLLVAGLPSEPPPEAETLESGTALTPTPETELAATPTPGAVTPEVTPTP